MVRQGHHESLTVCDLFIGFIDSLAPPSRVLGTVLALFEFGDSACYPAHDHRMGQRNSSLGYRFDGIAEDGLEPRRHPCSDAPDENLGNLGVVRILPNQKPP